MQVVKFQRVGGSLVSQVVWHYDSLALELTEEHTIVSMAQKKHILLWKFSMADKWTFLLDGACFDTGRAPVACASDRFGAAPPGNENRQAASNGS